MSSQWDEAVAVTHQEDRREVAIKHRRDRLKNTASTGGPPPLGLHLLQRGNRADASRNVITMLEAGQITLQVVIARRRG